MSGLKRMSYALLIFFILSSFTNVAGNYEILESSMVRDSRNQVLFTTSYTPHDPIVITNNSNFDSQGWVGNGTADEPYVIENLSITNQSECIVISNTTVYFEIRECLISATDQSDYGAIVLDNVTHGTVTGCIVDKHYYGVYIISSLNCTLTYNIATNSYWGYQCYSSSSITLINNTASDCEYGFTPFLSSCTMINNNASHNYLGYNLYNASFCNLTDNLAFENYYGFNLYYSNSCALTNNTSYGNVNSDFHLYDTSSCTLINNSGWGKGLSITGSSIFHWLHEISGNTIENQPIGYFGSISNITINGKQYGQIVLANCSFITLKNGIFDNVPLSIRLAFCINCTLTNNTVMNSRNDGFILWYSPMCVLSDNTAENNRGSGFTIRNSPNCTLANNYATRNGWSAFNLYNSSTCTLTNNIAFDNSVPGFSLEVSSYCTLTNNTAHENGSGFYISADSCILTNNTASDNLNGFTLYESTSCILTMNIVVNNIRGIFLSYYSSENLIFLNKLFANSEFNGKDDGFSNHWDNGTHGNFWDDYDGSGTYTIPGLTQSVDNHPHLYDLSPPDNPTTIPTTPTTTTTTTTSTPADEFWSLEDLLITGISIVSVTIIGLVLFLTVHAKRAVKTST